MSLFQLPLQAMNMLHMMRNSDRTLHEMLKLSPLKAWLVRHGHSSIVKFAQLEVSDFQAPLVFQVREWFHFSTLTGNCQQHYNTYVHAPFIENIVMGKFVLSCYYLFSSSIVAYPKEAIHL